RRTSSAARPATTTSGCVPPAASASRTQATKLRPASSRAAFGVPMRRESPPARTMPATGASPDGGSATRATVAAGQVVAEQALRVLGLVAIGAEILPVAAVRRVVIVVAVLVVDGQEVQVRRLELARAASADPAVQRQRSL